MYPGPLTWVFWEAGASEQNHERVFKSCGSAWRESCVLGVFTEDCRPAEQSCIKNNSVVRIVFHVLMYSDLGVSGDGASEQSTKVYTNSMAECGVCQILCGFS